MYGWLEDEQFLFLKLLSLLYIQQKNLQQSSKVKFKIYIRKKCRNNKKKKQSINKL